MKVFSKVMMASEETLKPHNVRKSYMATLYSTNKEKSISLYLYRDIENSEWLKYQIIVDYQKCNQMGKRIVFSEETAENILFLEYYLEPEIPELIKGFKDVFEDNVDI